MKRLRNLVAALALSAGAAAMPVATHTASASSPYGCWNPTGWGVRVCYQITGHSFGEPLNFVEQFRGAVTNYWGFGIWMLTQVRGPGGGYYHANLYIPARSTRTWAQDEYRDLPTGPYCVYYGAYGQFHACFSVLGI